MQANVLAVWFTFIMLNGGNFLHTVHVFGNSSAVPAWMSALLILANCSMIVVVWIQFCYTVVGRHRCFIGLYIFLLGVCICCALGDFSTLFYGLAKALDSGAPANATIA